MILRLPQEDNKSRLRKHQQKEVNQMTNNTGLGFFKDAENFLTDLSDLESEYIRGGNLNKATSRTQTTSCKAS